MPTHRPLNAGEAKVLHIIQEEHGPQNTEADVFFTDDDEAALFVKTHTGDSLFMVVLTHLAEWREDSIIASDQELRTDWLSIPTVAE